jgi:hypothetical protein
VTANPFLVVRVHDCFGGGTNGDMLFQFGLAGAGDPGDFGGETFDVVFLFFEDLFRDEHGEICVFDAHFLDFSVKPAFTDQRFIATKGDGGVRVIASQTL